MGNAYRWGDIAPPSVQKIKKRREHQIFKREWREKIEAQLKPFVRSEMASRGLIQKRDLEPSESGMPCSCVRHNRIEKSTPLRVCSGSSSTCLARCPSAAAEGGLPAELPPLSGRGDSIPSGE